ncbi:MAG: alanine--tRNA ligase [Anaerolineales bacterium]|nr:alanine--tRNA ligase [Anaerolineales bacterium]
MSTKKMTGGEIRQTFIDFFVEQGHTFVPSSSLVPGGDATLLFTNAGMVQFKDVFIGTDKRPYSRAANSQKCMRVAGKHNDLEDVGRDDTHHTFFEMLGNWSFGDYYKKEAITWAWQILTEVFGLPKDRLYATVFKDEEGEIPTDDEAAGDWLEQPGFLKDHLYYMGRADNFWEMAETGPCGPCSEIHIDLRPGAGPVTMETLDSDRFVELWNLVFIQYNRTGPDGLDPLPATHVDTGMGFERIVSVLQGVDSNYKTDLFKPVIEAVRHLTGESLEAVYENFTPYRVIADHARAAAFLIADGVVPGNVGRNYICRMIIRRAARFGMKLNLNEPFLAGAAEAVIGTYGDFYPELSKNREVILDSLTREEQRFARTVEAGMAQLDSLLDEVQSSGGKVLDGGKAFDLYATCGLPFEISRDIAQERSLNVDEAGFKAAMETHRLASGGGKAIGQMGGEDAEFYTGLLKDLQAAGKLGEEGVLYDPYGKTAADGNILALVIHGSQERQAQTGQMVEVIVPQTGFYIESGGQVADTGMISGQDWKIRVTDVRKPAAGIVVHLGEVVSGAPRVGDPIRVDVDLVRRRDIMRNHTATHLLHAALHRVLGEGARQAGSLVAPDRLRFDFNHPESLSADQLAEIELLVNDAVAADLEVVPQEKNREAAVAEGAMALFGEKYGETVRTVAIGETDSRHSYELCGGTHLERTSDVGIFLIVSESSAAAGVRRIEAVTGRAAYGLITRRFDLLKKAAVTLKASLEDVPQKVSALQDELSAARKEISALRAGMAQVSLDSRFDQADKLGDVSLLVLNLPGGDKESLSQMADRFREKFSEKGVCLAVAPSESNVLVMAAVTQDLIKRGIKAGDLVGEISRQLGAGGGGAPHLAFGGGKDVSKVPQALESVRGWLENKIE